MELRRIRPGEHAAAGDVCVAAYEPFLTGAEDDYRARLHDVARRDAEAEVWVAVDGDRLLGNVTFCPPGSPWREIGRSDEGEFRMLAVDPAAQGAGAGTALATLCEERARLHGATGMALSSLATMVAAHRVYARLGYVRDPQRDWSPMPGVDLIAFAKPF
ncbi:GNAT family N-acetyltransferase [Nocardioides sp. S-58]|uniref:GNAT family N-acetyltransferase n=1 Tax=Nocardioides renjunii TaxID=3095075 RepID=A0ABU5KC62_9ACTN|nr:MULTISPECIES: GNAT family N-acetyltransferase [unclassified Nocardioides]MDZ5662563.1 GNAT family N-acetyltransferase [Nocardioides sp. S-58]WQQ23642.1 GNAT family N-acetyltransferase [Nocardioides sp. S-34]